MQQPFILKKEISNIHNAYHIFNIALKIIKPKLLVKKKKKVIKQ